MDVALATLWPLRILAMLLGVYVEYRVLRSAVQTFVLPRAITDEVARAVFLMVRGLFDLRTHMATTYAERDRIMAFYAPAALLTLTATWLALVVIAYTLIYWGVELGNLDHDFIMNGSSLFTLGFAGPSIPGASALVFTEAGCGLLLAALLVAYLPTIYNNWQQRERIVALLEVHAGTPPSSWEMITRMHRIRGLEHRRSPPMLPGSPIGPTATVTRSCPCGIASHPGLIGRGHCKGKRSMRFNSHAPF